MKIKIVCPHCSKSYEIGSEHVGKTVRCDSCKTEFPISGSVITGTAQDMKTCPMCGEKILATARKCRYCGEYLAKDGTSYIINITRFEKQNSVRPKEYFQFPAYRLKGLEVNDMR